MGLGYKIMIRILNAFCLEIREMLPPAPAAPTIKMADARNRAIARGFTNDQFEEAVEEYEELDVFTVNAARTRLTVVGDN